MWQGKHTECFTLPIYGWTGDAEWKCNKSKTNLTFPSLRTDTLNPFSLGWRVTSETGVRSCCQVIFTGSWKTRLIGGFQKPPWYLIARYMRRSIQRESQMSIHLLLSFQSKRRIKQQSVLGVQEQPRGKQDAWREGVSEGAEHSPPWPQQAAETPETSRLSQLLSALLGKVPTFPEGSLPVPQGRSHLHAKYS